MPRRPQKRRKIVRESNVAVASVSTEPQIPDDAVILERNKQEQDFLRWYSTVLDRYNAMDSDESEENLKEICSNYFVIIANISNTFEDRSLRIIDDPTSIECFTRFFVLNHCSAWQNAHIDQHILRKFVLCDTFGKAIVSLRDAYMNGWEDYVDITCPLYEYPQYLFRRNHKEQTFWYVYLTNKLVVTIDLQNSLLMVDPLINEYVTYDGVSKSIFNVLSLKGEMQILHVILTRPDLDITSRSIRECGSNNKFKMLVRARYDTRRNTCMGLFVLHQLLNGIRELQILVLNFLL